MPADLRVIKPADRVLDQASGGMRREAAISKALVGAEKVWLGYVELDPGEISAAHHHGEAESGIYVISGNARFVTESGTYEAEPGDVVWVAPQVVHVEVNRSWSEPIRMIVVRSTQQTLVFNVDMPEGWAARAVG
ncbi:MAG TPA: cupin domain-containing protein [Candidatus Limnocylindria bacterium]|nr:cupin domain-containing protein [Candidatus Limnocylindria bacterium]